ncbi:MAG: hypothetical protein P8012_09300 [Desulfobacterales bacterium]
MIEKTSSDRNFFLEEVPCLDDLLVKHFGNIEERIFNAGSWEKALEIVEDAISSFRRECISETLLEFLKYDMKTMIDRYWQPEPGNLNRKRTAI